MNRPADVAPPPPGARYQDVLDAPEGMIAEIVDGVLRLRRRPAARHQFAFTCLTAKLSGPFDRGRGGQGGCSLAVEPELHLGEDALAPDLAGWRRTRMPVFPDAPAIGIAPNWVCEVLSPSTRLYERREKRARYAHHRVAFLWLLAPEARTLEAFALGPDGRWTLTGAFGPGDRFRAEPFDSVPIAFDDLPPEGPEAAT